MIRVRNPRPAGMSQTQADGAEERAAIIYQHHARGADTVITRAIDAHADSERAAMTATAATHRA